jgi:hypothetical protein
MAKYLDISRGALLEQDREVKELPEKQVLVAPEGSSRYQKYEDGDLT